MKLEPGPGMRWHAGIFLLGRVWDVSLGGGRGGGGGISPINPWHMTLDTPYREFIGRGRSALSHHHDDLQPFSYNLLFISCNFMKAISHRKKTLIK